MNEQPSNLLCSTSINEDGGFHIRMTVIDEPPAIRQAQREQDRDVFATGFVVLCCFLLGVGVVIGSLLR